MNFYSILSDCQIAENFAGMSAVRMNIPMELLCTSALDEEQSGIDNIAV